MYKVDYLIIETLLSSFIYLIYKLYFHSNLKIKFIIYCYQKSSEQTQLFSIFLIFYYFFSNFSFFYSLVFLFLFLNSAKKYNIILYVIVIDVTNILQVSQLHNHITWQDIIKTIKRAQLLTLEQVRYTQTNFQKYIKQTSL